MKILYSHNSIELTTPAIWAEKILSQDRIFTNLHGRPYLSNKEKGILKDVIDAFNRKTSKKEDFQITDVLIIHKAKVKRFLELHDLLCNQKGLIELGITGIANNHYVGVIYPFVEQLKEQLNNA
ncbi:MAG: hypothetical protein IJ904_07690 [Candidatus Methanomethylophilaceae archaeon]|nr:hypothetical protein [Candidatus Methanomethylophilaceae archaeon]